VWRADQRRLARLERASALALCRRSAHQPASQPGGLHTCQRGRPRSPLKWRTLCVCVCVCVCYAKPVPCKSALGVQLARCRRNFGLDVYVGRRCSWPTTPKALHGDAVGTKVNCRLVTCNPPGHSHPPLGPLQSPLQRHCPASSPPSATHANPRGQLDIAAAIKTTLLLLLLLMRGPAAPTDCRPRGR